MAAKEAMEAARAGVAYNKGCLDAWVAEQIGLHGSAIVKRIVASTITARCHSWDERITREAREWAAAHPDKDPQEFDYWANIHPTVLDAIAKCLRG